MCVFVPVQLHVVQESSNDGAAWLTFYVNFFLYDNKSIGRTHESI